MGLRRHLTAAGAVAAALAAAAGAPSAAPATRATVGDGGWSWFADPRAVHHHGRAHRTYFGWVDRAGSVRVAAYDHGSRVRTSRPSASASASTTTTTRRCTSGPTGASSPSFRATAATGSSSASRRARRT
jgi:hypothetical protein